MRLIKLGSNAFRETTPLRYPSNIAYDRVQLRETASYYWPFLLLHIFEKLEERVKRSQHNYQLYY